MPFKRHKDEQYPLLFFVNDNQDNSFNRGKGITSGVTTVLNKWPDNATSGWLTAFICFTFFMFLSLFLLISISSQGTFQCGQSYKFQNNTIHLVHNTGKWHRTELENVDEIIRHFPNYTIHLVLIKRKSNELPKRLMELFENRSVLTETVNYYEIFNGSPLLEIWPMLNEQLRVFAARILQMWQFGGYNYDLYQKIDRFFHSDFKLSSEIVSTDSKGLHFATNAACHVFFEEILKLLKKSTGYETVQDIINKALDNFCKTQRKFCKVVKD